MLSLSLGIAFASNRTIQGTISDIKVYLNNQNVEADVLIVNDTSYLPVKVISELLDLTVNWDGSTRSIMLSSDASANDSVEVEEYVTQIENLNEQVTQLESQLQLYKGEIPNIDKTKATFEVASGETTKIFENQWNKQLLFRANDKVFDEDTVGIKIEAYKQGQFTTLLSDYPTSKFGEVKFYNSDLDYTTLNFTLGTDSINSTDYLDDNKINYTIYAYSSVTGHDNITQGKQIDKVVDGDLTHYSYDITGYEKIYLYLLPSVNGNVKYNSTNDAYDFTIKASAWNEGYILLINPTIE